MKTIEKLLAEYKIRFRDTHEVKGSKNNGNLNQYIDGMGNVFNVNEKVRCTHGYWKTADLKEAPKKWVVEKDESNPIWEEFKEATLSVMVTEPLQWISEKDANASILYFKNHQYLTLEQWKQFFGRTEPKDDDLVIAYSNLREEQKKIKYNNIHIRSFKSVRGSGYPYYYIIDDTKPIPPQLDEFLKLKKYYDL